jgi:UDP-glucose 4-epimerase
MKLLLIGSEGFIGRHCVQYFLNKQWEVTGCDLVDYTSASYTYFKISRLQPSYEPVFEDATYDVCINAAGNGSVPVSIAHPLTDFEANCYDVVRVLELLRTKNPSCKYIHFSSAAVYGNPVQLPVAETDRLSPLSPYGWHKLIAEQLCQEYHRLYNLPVVILRPFSVYGEGLRKQLFWDLYKKIRQAAGNGNRVVLYGTGRESRDFIHIQDLCRTIDTLISKAAFACDVVNIGCGKETTIADAARFLAGKVDDKIVIEFGGEVKPGDPLNWRANIQKLEDMGFSWNIGIDKGLTDLAIWLQEKS